MLVLILCIKMRPLLTFVYYRTNLDRIVSELCVDRKKPITVCAGRCYLQNQLDQSEQLPTTQNQQVKFAWENMPVYYSVTSTIEFQRSSDSVSKVAFRGVDEYKSLKHRPPTPPPKS